MTTSPILIPNSRAKKPIPPVAESTWPAITVEPNGSPAYALPSHHPTCRTSSGTLSMPFTVAAGFTSARALPGSTSRRGSNCTRSLLAGRPSRAGGTGEVAAGRSVSVGRD